MYRYLYVFHLLKNPTYCFLRKKQSGTLLGYPAPVPVVSRARPYDMYSRKVGVPRLPGIVRFRPLVIVSLVYLGSSLLLRLFLWKIVGPAAGVSWPDLLSILVTGVFNDGVALVFLNIPWVCYLTFMPDGLVRTQGHRVGFAFFVFVSFFALFYLAGVEIFFFQKGDTRFSRMALEYLSASLEVPVPLWKFFPFVISLLIDGVMAALILLKVWPAMDRAFTVRTTLAQRLPFFAGYIFLLIPVVWIFPGTCATFDNRVADELARNGMTRLVQAVCARFPEYRADFWITKGISGKYFEP